MSRADRIEVGSRLRAHRHRLGESLSDVASRIRVALNTVSRWERGLAMPNRLAIPPILDAYRMTGEDRALVSRLLGAEEPVASISSTSAA